MPINFNNLNNIYNKLDSTLNNIKKSQKAFKTRMVNIERVNNRLANTNSYNKKINTKLITRNISNNSKNYNKINNAIKQATSANYLTNLQTKLNAGSLGKYSQLQMQKLERAILDKKFALSNAQSPLNIKAVKYDFNAAIKMNAKNLNTLTTKISKEDATRLYKDMRNGAYNTSLTKQEINQISFTILNSHKLF